MYTVGLLLVYISLHVDGSSLTSETLHVSDKLAHEHAITKRAIGYYEDIGSFDSSTFYHAILRPIYDLPESRDTVDTQFKLFTRSNKLEGSAQTLAAHNSGSLKNSTFQSDRPTKFIVHGFNGYSKSQWVVDMKDAFLLQGDYNVIVVDWEHGAGGEYSQATANTWLVGGEIALLLQALQAHMAASLSDVHLVGFSLGAHVCGYAGARLHGKNNSLGRITGLDPADPFFQGMPAAVRLDPTDAEFVDAIHTDGNHIIGVLALEGGLGMKDPVGHVDFYPNGGKDQPGCDSHFLHELWTVVTGSLEYVLCDHRRAYELFTESISSECEMTAYPCDNYDEFKGGKCLDCGTIGCGVMGLKADITKPPADMVNVKYYLHTAPAAPFCEHHVILTVTLSDNSERTHGKVNVKLLNDDNIRFATSLGPKYFSGGDILSSDVMTVKSSWDHVTELHIDFDCTAPAWRLFYCWRSEHNEIILESVQIYHFESRTRTWFCGSGEVLTHKSHPMSIQSRSSC